MLPVNRQPGARELRKFARLWFPLFVTALGAALWWRLGSPIAGVIVWGLGGALAVAVLARAEIARVVFVGLITITYPIGLLVSTAALAIMFYGVFTPLGLLMRASGRDPLRLRARGAPSDWLAYEQNDDAERAFRQY